MSDLMASRQGSSRLRVDGVSEDYAVATADDDVDQLHLDLQRAVDGRPSFPAGRQSRSVQYLLQLAAFGDHPRHGAFGSASNASVLPVHDEERSLYGDAIHPVRPQFQVLIELHLHRVLQVAMLLFQRLHTLNVALYPETPTGGQVTAGPFADLLDLPDGRHQVLRLQGGGQSFEVVGTSGNFL